jgi:hypothetical protein
MKEPVQLFWIFQVLRGLWKGRYAYHRTLVYISLSSNTLPNLSQFFSILTDLNVIKTPSQALQIIFEMQSQSSSQKQQERKCIFSNCKTCFFSVFFIFTPPTVSVHKITTFPSFFLQPFSSHFTNGPLHFLWSVYITFFARDFSECFLRNKIYTRQIYKWGKNE